MQHAADQLILDRVQKFRSDQFFDGPKQSLMGRLSDHVSDTGLDPTSYVARCFDRHDIVFLGEFGRSHQVGLLLQDLVPALVDAGVWILAVEWLLSDDQHLIDELMAGEDYDANLAHALVFRWGIRHASIFTEYIDVLEAAWEANQRLDANAPRFRVLGLDYELNYSAVTERADLLLPEAWPHLRDRGPAGRCMADVLKANLSASRQRALVLCSTSHALTHQRRAVHPCFDRIDVDIVDGRVIGMGNHLYAWRADRVFTVLLHQPLPGPVDHGADLVFGADGIVDMLFAQPDSPKYPIGFDISHGPFSSLPCRTAHDEPMLGGWTNGYVFLESVTKLTGPTPCFSLIDEDHLDEARRRVLPGSLRAAEIGVEEIKEAIECHAAFTEQVWSSVGL